ncbi:hypothetical protein [Kineococcus sp. NPDC059986]|uniref:hypothetical protein n=1 Tax=Kineococcus sp. NPDC059986 TaxID=3155538 RepID=UPI00344F1E67
MAATRRRWAAAAGAVLALLAAAPASAASSARAQNTPAQLVTAANWAVVVVSGTSPATTPGPPATFTSAVGIPAYLTLTNLGNVVPGTMTLTGRAGLTLLGNVQICLDPWSGGTCSRQLTWTSAVFTANGSPAPPDPGQSWYLKTSGLVVVGGTMSAVTAPPAARTVNS